MSSQPESEKALKQAELTKVERSEIIPTSWAWRNPFPAIETERIWDYSNNCWKLQPGGDDEHDNGKS